MVPLYNEKRFTQEKAIFNSKKCFKDEIKQDLVNEMVSVFSKGQSDTAKEAISTQIYEMSEV